MVTKKRETKPRKRETHPSKWAINAHERDVCAEILARWADLDSGAFVAERVELSVHEQQRTLVVHGRSGDKTGLALQTPISVGDTWEAAQNLAAKFSALYPKRPPLSLVAQAVHNAGVVCGYRRALQAVAVNLRQQASELRKPVTISTLREHLVGLVMRDDGFKTADLLDACALSISTECEAQAAKEQQLTRAAEAMLAAAGGGK